LENAEQRLLLQLAETRLAEAQRSYERLEQLVARGASTATQLDEAETNAEIARLEVERAREALDDRILRAPFDGVAGLTDMEPGAWVDNNMEIAAFDDRSAILVGFDLPEAMLARVKPGLPVAATTPAAPGQVFEGEIADIDTRIAADSRTVRVRVAIPNPEDRLRPGASFSVRLDLPGEDYPVVPEIAVLFGKNGLHVWRVAGDEVEQVDVEMIRRRDGEVLVSGPLQPGDKVVIEGTQRLSPGKKIRLLTPTAPAS
ncbi:MAG: efflux RND transporter periplasmic adaptor subunit, partial [Pseudomonadota bacterium]